MLHNALAENSFPEITISSLHGLTATSLPPIHKDPFDRMLIAQSIVEGCLLLTSNRTLARYDAPVQLVV
jgi:PIN domain nuclease of toxin-antitoxin system